jgi:hypothetical protein
LPSINSNLGLRLQRYFADLVLLLPNANNVSRLFSRNDEFFRILPPKGFKLLLLVSNEAGDVLD